MKNKSSTHNVEYVYVDSISEDAIVVNEYGKHRFEFYYYDQETDEFLYYNGRQYRQLYVNEMKKTGTLFVCMIDTENKLVKYNTPKKEANSIRRVSQQSQDNEQDDQLSLFPFRSKIKQYERINKEKITIPTQIKDIKVKPLSKLQRPYFSPKIGSWEIDIIFGTNPSTRRTRLYLFAININTKYLVVIPMKDKSSDQLKIALKKLMKQVYVNNIRGDGETGFKANVIKQFKNEQSLEVDLKKYTSQEEAERVAAEQRQRAQQRYRVQRQEFRSSANDLQLILIRRLQKTVVTNIGIRQQGNLSLACW
ncbi:MAG: hypothetical protein EZS28_009123 [Streblomastix strix]|uniref:Integrase catalytic domain-containing protein n=1 Tax=Streblomastix strix TaxID=222440 RepID=A0A5J4WKG5_9EUKA|nr:MAG: hypothetical protein EZS28_009123 [Streblomastix strix]